MSSNSADFRKTTWKARPAISAKSSPLLIAKLLDRGVRIAGDEKVVTVGAFGVHTQTYAETRARACQLAHALSALGISRGDRVATLMWNGHRHLEAFYAVPAMGAVLHTINMRLAPSEIEYVINHAEDRLFLVDEDLLPMLMPMLERLSSVRHMVIASTGGDWKKQLPDALDWEEMIADGPSDYDWPTLDEDAPHGLCYTSGTTGNPKGVIHTHRSTYLHTMVQAMTDVVGLTATDCILQVVPMCHVWGWGYPFTATMLGARQIMVHGSWKPDFLLDLIEREKITFSSGVPTIWQTVRAAIEAEPNRWDLSALERINCGAAAPPASLIRWYWDHLDIEMIHSWGMTETNPLGATSRRLAKRKHLELGLDEQLGNMAKTGLPLPGLEIKIADDDGRPLPNDGETVGNLLVRGPWVCSEYYGDPLPERFPDGWLHTGDLAKIDPEHYLIISDRSKDLIKSGGEWISSIDVENHIVAMPGVLKAAVVGQPHPKWGERPVALVELKPGATLKAEQVIDHCASKFASWQLPDDVLFMDSMPLNSTGKLDKQAIREHLDTDGYLLPDLRGTG
ncbi:MAG: long-chain fatty acid--CoA ligase [Alphaproteobacteria bacterium]|nr:long-chain fatty acid--CoA ligase [Alphaproteobacteria bacterium]